MSVAMPPGHDGLFYFGYYVLRFCLKVSDSPELELQKSSCHVGARKTNLGLLEEQQVPLTAEPSLSPNDGLTLIPLKP